MFKDFDPERDIGGLFAVRHHEQRGISRQRYDSNIPTRMIVSASWGKRLYGSDPEMLEISGYLLNASVPRLDYDPNNPAEVLNERRRRWQVSPEEIWTTGVHRGKECSVICELVQTGMERSGFHKPELVKTLFKREDGSFGTHTLLYFNLNNKHYIWNVSAGLSPASLEQKLEAGDYLTYRDAGYPEDAGYIDKYFLIWKIAGSLGEMGLHTAADLDRELSNAQEMWNPPESQNS